MGLGSLGGLTVWDGEIEGSRLGGGSAAHVEARDKKLGSIAGRSAKKVGTVPSKLLFDKSRTCSLRKLEKESGTDPVNPDLLSRSDVRPDIDPTAEGKVRGCMLQFNIVLERKSHSCCRTGDTPLVGTRSSVSDVHPDMILAEVSEKKTKTTHKVRRADSRNNVGKLTGHRGEVNVESHTLCMWIESGAISFRSSIHKNSFKRFMLATHS
ncbi:hypothetical protein BC829DRAFT_385847 [Chytridium lagenaria]|nr:hypothetical protein BC829DRAFT_385847 [Chytridium lagenaria]